MRLAMLPVDYHDGNHVYDMAQSTKSCNPSNKKAVSACKWQVRAMNVRSFVPLKNQLPVCCGYHNKIYYY
jgi:hypothetical protein